MSARREGNWFCPECGEANWSYSLQCRKVGCYQFQHCSAQDEEIESEELEGRRECEEIQYTDVFSHKPAKHIDNKAEVDTTEEVIDVFNSKTKEAGNMNQEEVIEDNDSELKEKMEVEAENRNAEEVIEDQDSEKKEKILVEFGTRNQEEVTEDRDNKMEENKEVVVGIIMEEVIEKIAVESETKIEEEVIENEESVSPKAGGDSGRNINNNIQNPRSPRHIVKNIYLFDTDDEDEDLGLYSPGGPRSDEEG